MAIYRSEGAGLGVTAVATADSLLASILSFEPSSIFLMPLAIQRVGLDPAVSSTPFVASLVDVFGLIVYFSIARLMMSVAF